MRSSVYLGGNAFYHVYAAIPDAALEKWPTVVADLTKALQIKRARNGVKAADNPWGEVVEGLSCAVPPENYIRSAWSEERRRFHASVTITPGFSAGKG